MVIEACGYPILFYTNKGRPFMPDSFFKVLEENNIEISWV